MDKTNKDAKILNYLNAERLKHMRVVGIFLIIRFID